MYFIPHTSDEDTVREVFVLWPKIFLRLPQFVVPIGKHKILEQSAGETLAFSSELPNSLMLREVLLHEYVSYRSVG